MLMQRINGYTVLHIAAWSGNKDLVEYLIRKDLDAHTKDNFYDNSETFKLNAALIYMNLILKYRLFIFRPIKNAIILNMIFKNL